MDKIIPTIFDATVIESSIQDIALSGNTSLNRIKVRAFTKYGNRNGSYITDAVADQLIASATQGDTPVIGFFDPATETWASHTGPTLANAYGYVEDFLGWESFTDTDGVNREYAVFSVILFTKYYEEAKKILGQNQSMELDPSSITGQWTEIDGNEYYVYSTAKMLGFCVIGSHEPCFSVSAFFAKKDDTFSSLMFDFKALVEEVKNMNNQGGEQPMEELEQVVEVQENEPAPENENFEVEENVEDTSEDTSVQEVSDNSEVENFQARLEELQAAYDALQTNYEAAQNEIAELKSFQETATTELDTLRGENKQLHDAISAYEVQIAEQETGRKVILIQKYEKIMDEEEINDIKEHINDFSYDEIESKLAIRFANHQIASEQEIKKVPLPEPQESQFALLMKKYRKN